VARGTLREDTLFYTGKLESGALTDKLPMPVTAELLERGRVQYQTFCAPCHGRTGSGDGMIVQRGFKKPFSYHIDRLRLMPVGYFFDVSTNGFGAMADYATQVRVEDRWAIAAYILTLIARTIFARVGLYRHVWHRALFDFSAYVCLLGGIVYLSKEFVS